MLVIFRLFALFTLFVAALALQSCSLMEKTINKVWGEDEREKIDKKPYEEKRRPAANPNLGNLNLKDKNGNILVAKLELAANEVVEEQKLPVVDNAPNNIDPKDKDAVRTQNMFPFKEYAPKADEGVLLDAVAPNQAKDNSANNKSTGDSGNVVNNISETPKDSNNKDNLVKNSEVLPPNLPAELNSNAANKIDKKIENSDKKIEGQVDNKTKTLTPKENNNLQAKSEGDNVVKKAAKTKILTKKTVEKKNKVAKAHHRNHQKIVKKDKKIIAKIDNEVRPANTKPVPTTSNNKEIEPNKDKIIQEPLNILPVTKESTVALPKAPIVDKKPEFFAPPQIVLPANDNKSVAVQVNTTQAAERNATGASSNIGNLPKSRYSEE